MGVCLARARGQNVTLEKVAGCVRPIEGSPAWAGMRSINQIVVQDLKSLGPILYRPETFPRIVAEFARRAARP